eukprot:1160342-Pelagomonas_calceolata.AAC.4
MIGQDDTPYHTKCVWVCMRALLAAEDEPRFRPQGGEKRPRCIKKLAGWHSAGTARAQGYFLSLLPPSGTSAPSPHVVDGAPSIVHSQPGAVGAADLLQASNQEVVLENLTAEPAALATRVVALLDDRDKLLQVARRAAARARSWTEARNAQELLRIIRLATELDRELNQTNGSA